MSKNMKMITIKKYSKILEEMLKNAKIFGMKNIRVEKIELKKILKWKIFEKFLHIPFLGADYM